MLSYTNDTGTNHAYNIHRIMNYIKSSADLKSTQIRLFLIGPPKSGKTFSAATFPDPIFVDFDKGLTSPELRERKLKFLPMYDNDFIKNEMKQQNSVNALTWFLKNEAPKLTNEQTIVLDSLSTIGDVVMEDCVKRTPINNGKPEGYWTWTEWAKWWLNLCHMFNSLTCHVVVTAHEKEIRNDETGKLEGYLWLMKGKDFSPRMPQFFTDIFRQIKTSKEAGGKITEEFNWQVKGDTAFPFACTRMTTDQKLVKADFSVLRSAYKF